MRRLLNSAFVLVALLIAATAAWRSHSPAMSFSTDTAAVRPQAPNAAEREFAATLGSKPTPEIKKPVR
jgi:hypothetical protein